MSLLSSLLFLLATMICVHPVLAKSVADQKKDRPSEQAKSKEINQKIKRYQQLNSQVLKSPGILNYSIERKDFLKIIKETDKALGNESYSQELASMGPSEKKVKLEGIRVQGIKEGGLFSLLKLKAGDLIIKLNQKRVVEKIEFNHLVKSLTDAKQIVIQIVRDNVPLTLLTKITN